MSQLEYAEKNINMKFNDTNKRVVFITSDFLPNPDANGVCVFQLAKEFINQGDEVIVISDSNGRDDIEFINGIKIYRIKSLLLKKYSRIANKDKSFKITLLYYLSLLLQRFKTLILLFLYPNSSPLRARKINKTLKKINDEKNIDILISAYRPYESIAAALKFKKRNDKTKLVLYFLDVLTLDNKPLFFPKYLYNKLIDSSKYKQYETSDLILLPVSTQVSNYFSFEDHGDKIKKFDYPLFNLCDKKVNTTKKANFRKLNLVYTGNLDLNNRNPAYLIELLLEISKIIPLTINIYGNLNDYLIPFAKRAKNFEDTLLFHGYVPISDIQRIQSEADMLINISNKQYPQMIPSKIFQYFSTGKPIINLTYNENDATVKYFKKYSLTHFVEAKNIDSEKYRNDLRELREFIEEKNSAYVSTFKLKKMYEKNTPKYTVNLIKKNIKKDNYIRIK